MGSQAKSIVEQLQEVVANLRGHAHEVWIGTDISSDAAMERSQQFVKLLNGKLAKLDQVTAEIVTAIQQFSGVKLEGNHDSSDTALSAHESDMPSGRLQLFPIEGNYNYTSRYPYGYRLLGHSYHNLSTWSDMYRMILRQLAQYSPDTFQELPDREESVGGRRHRSEEYRVSFNRTGEGLNRGYQVTRDVWADIGYDANAICRHISRLLKVFDIPKTDFELYLRVGNRASGPMKAK